MGEYTRERWEEIKALRPQGQIKVVNSRAARAFGKLMPKPERKFTKAQMRASTKGKRARANRENGAK